MRRWARTPSRREWLRVSGFAAAVVALFVLTWTFSVAIWKGRRIEERWCARMDT